MRRGDGTRRGGVRAALATTVSVALAVGVLAVTVQQVRRARHARATQAQRVAAAINASMAALPEWSGISASRDGTVLVISGTLDAAAQKRLETTLAVMEPGLSVEWRVAPYPSAGEEPVPQGTSATTAPAPAE